MRKKKKKKKELKDCSFKVYDALDKSHLQVLMFSATLHSDEVARLSARICKFPTWVDLKGKDSVPLTVQHVRVAVDPLKVPKFKSSAAQLEIATDGVHANDKQARVKNTRENLSVNPKKREMTASLVVDNFSKGTSEVAQSKVSCRDNQSLQDRAGYHFYSNAFGCATLGDLFEQAQ